jgi:sulfite dehydrogenase (quinone) subunit SoeA
MMHMVITNAWKGDPYEIDTLFFYMANMAWNSAMNTVSTIAMLTDKKPDGSYRIPFIIVADAYASETVAYADLVLPDTTYLERWDCISLLDRPSGEADAACDAIRQPVVEPDRDVRPFQDVLIELGVRLGLPGLVTEDGSARYPGGYADYMVNHQRKPGIGPLAGWRGETGEAQGTGAPNPDQLDRYIENECFWRHEFAPKSAITSTPTRPISKPPCASASSTGPTPSSCSSIASRCRNSASPPVATATCSPRRNTPSASSAISTRCPCGTRRSRTTRARRLPAPCRHPAPHGDVSQLGLAERLAAPDPQLQPPVRALRRGGSAGIVDDDWVWLTSRTGRVHCQVTVMAGVNASTVWTWNAIGKRAGAWGLDPAHPKPPAASCSTT